MVKIIDEKYVTLNEYYWITSVTKKIQKLKKDNCEQLLC